MDNVDYIFTQAEEIYKWGLIISTIIGSVGIIFLISQFKKRYYTKLNGEKVDKRVVGILATCLGIGIFYSVTNQTNFYRDLKKDIATTEGITIRKYYEAKTNLIEFSYNVGGVKYKRSCGFTYCKRHLSTTTRNEAGRKVNGIINAGRV